jgi:hypothetical protein
MPYGSAGATIAWTGLSLIGGSIGDTIHMLVLGTIVQ